MDPLDPLKKELRAREELLKAQKKANARDQRAPHSHRRRFGQPAATGPSTKQHMSQPKQRNGKSMRRGTK
ncbi:MAG: hypothetical protein MHM6MM_000600 [Cercozoa sp. M6MM]